ncbi:MAG: hypothetical protein J5585_06945 [Clostridia bacterium]|nr:hypothetical protein [Clostridia bacterium]
MKNVLLIGDSMRMLYQQRVAELLGDDVHVYAPEENCRFTKFALWGMFFWMMSWGNPKIDVVHWNTGIWDLHRCTADGKVFTPLDEYLQCNERLAIQMESYTKNLIWATMTPGGRQLDEQTKTNYLLTQKGEPQFFLCDYTDVWNADIKRYNEACAKMLSARGVKINDLYSVIAADPDRYLAADGIHASLEGIEALAVQVADNIRSML